MKTQTSNNNATELDLRTQSPVERALDHFLCDQGPMNVTRRRKSALKREGKLTPISSGDWLDRYGAWRDCGLY